MTSLSNCFEPCFTSGSAPLKNHTWHRPSHRYSQAMAVHPGLLLIMNKIKLNHFSSGYLLEFLWHFTRGSTALSLLFWNIQVTELTADLAFHCKAAPWTPALLSNDNMESKAHFFQGCTLKCAVSFPSCYCYQEKTQNEHYFPNKHCQADYGTVQMQWVAKLESGSLSPGDWRERENCSTQHSEWHVINHVSAGLEAEGEF